LPLRGFHPSRRRLLLGCGQGDKDRDHDKGQEESKGPEGSKEPAKDGKESSKEASKEALETQAQAQKDLMSDMGTAFMVQGKSRGVGLPPLIQSQDACPVMAGHGSCVCAVQATATMTLRRKRRVCPGRPASQSWWVVLRSISFPKPCFAYGLWRFVPTSPRSKSGGSC
jgi:hypothetical protein